MSIPVPIPEKLAPLFAPAFGSMPVRGAYGGRGGGKSYTFARMAAEYGAVQPLKIICLREIQKSVKESFYAEVKNAINDCHLKNYYEIGKNYITCGETGTEFIFEGLRHNLGSIKSTSGISLAIIEEAEDVSEEAMRELFPTVRQEHSEIWLLWNPKKKDSPVNRRFRENCPKDAMIVSVNIDDNPFVSQVLLNRRESDREILNPSEFAHVWGGAYLERTEAQILADKYEIDTINVENWGSPYFGLDWGMKNDPTACVKFYISQNSETLYIEKEFYKQGADLDATVRGILEEMPEAVNHKIPADNAWPHSIAHLKKNGFPKIQPVKKGRIEDGIKQIRGFKRVIIAPSCKNVAYEFEMYSYKVDKAGKPLDIIVDAYNHSIDAIRYGLTEIDKGGFNMGFF